MKESKIQVIEFHEKQVSDLDESIKSLKHHIAPLEDKLNDAQRARNVYLACINQLKREVHEE